MTIFWFQFLQRRAGLIFRLALCVGVAVLVTGCHIFPPLPNAVQDMGSRYHPSNIYRQAAVLPMQLHRVALLPVTALNETPYLQAGLASQSTLVYAELEKCKRFEIIPVTPDNLRQWTGKTGWRTEEPLPPDFFAKIADATGCDAVMFCQLTRCDPYPPIAVGWKLSLVAVPPPCPQSYEAMRHQILWAADEVIDAGEPGVANSAHDYYNQHMRNETASADMSTILTSPTHFGQYTLSALFATLPQRWAPVADRR